MQKEDSVTVELVLDIFSKETPEYHHIKELAGKNIGQELISRIDAFLEEHRKERPMQELKKIVFEDASKIKDQSINDIVDAFVKMRTEQTLDEIDTESINHIMILFNQWIALGKGSQEKGNAQGIFDILAEIEQKAPQKNVNLEEQIAALKDQQGRLSEIYSSHSMAIAPTRQFYSSESETYSSIAPEAMFVFGEHDSSEHNAYHSRAIYKTH